MAGRRQKVAAILVAVSALGKPVSAASLLDVSGTPALDPFASLHATEAGIRTRIFGVDTQISAWRATAAAELALLTAGNTAWTERPAQRQGVRATLRYEPAAWLSLDFEAAVLRGRYADGGSEPVPGAVRRYGQAGATLRPGRGWNASLFVTAFDARPSSGDNPMRARSASFVSGRITRHLTKTTRVSLDLFNLLDKRAGNLDYFSATRLWSYPGAADNFIFYPGESRGLRLRLRTTF